MLNVQGTSDVNEALLLVRNKKPVAEKIERSDVVRKQSAAVGALFTVLYEVVKDVKDETMMFRELRSERYKEVLDQSNQEVEKIVRQIANGEELVLKCSKLSTWKGFKKYKYAKKLLDLDKCLNRLPKILNGEGVRYGFENLAILRENLAVSKEALAAVQKNGLVGNRENIIVEHCKGYPLAIKCGEFAFRGGYRDKRDILLLKVFLLDTLDKEMVAIEECFLATGLPFRF
ncbi:unnamed protein product [Malus baccata var. baccata]